MPTVNREIFREYDIRGVVEEDLDVPAVRAIGRAIGRELSKPRDMLVVHMFNHQTHHRGQVHAMLTAAGARPDDTDLPLMAEQ